MAVITGFTPYGKAAFPTHRVPNLTVRLTYADALQIALPYYNAFYDKHQWFMEHGRGKDYDWRRFHETELRALANGCCAACEMLCDLFEMSDEQVHDDLAALREIGA